MFKVLMMAGVLPLSFFLSACGGRVEAMNWGHSDQFYGTFSDRDDDKAKSVGASEGYYSATEIDPGLGIWKVTGNPWKSDGLQRTQIGVLKLTDFNANHAQMIFNDDYLKTIRLEKSDANLTDEMRANPPVFLVSDDHQSATQTFDSSKLGPSAHSVTTFQKLSADELKKRSDDYKAFQDLCNAKAKEAFGPLAGKKYELTSMTVETTDKAGAVTAQTIDAKDIQEIEKTQSIGPDFKVWKDDHRNVAFPLAPADEFTNVKTVNFLNYHDDSKTGEALVNGKVTMDVRFAMDGQRGPLQMSFWTKGRSLDLPNWSMSGVITTTADGLTLTDTQSSDPSVSLRKRIYNYKQVQ